MKTSFLIGAAVFALALGSPGGLMVVNSALPAVVQAQAEVDFEQGALSDEEYLKHVINQFNELKTIESVTTSTGGAYNNISTTISDLQTGAFKVDTTFTDETEGQNVVRYF